MTDLSNIDWKVVCDRATGRYQMGMREGEQRYREDQERRQEDAVGYWKGVLVRKMLAIEWICEQVGKLTGKEFAVVLLEKERGEGGEIENA